MRFLRIPSDELVAFISRSQIRHETSTRIWCASTIVNREFMGVLNHERKLLSSTKYNVGSDSRAASRGGGEGITP